MAAELRRIAPGEGRLLRDVRLAALADSPSAFASAYDEESQWPPSAWEDKAARWSTGRAEASFVAEIGGRVVGLVGAYLSEQDQQTVELVSMWVAPDARGQGIGARLVECVVTWALETGARRVALWVVRGNGPAAALYERCGFERTDTTGDAGRTGVPHLSTSDPCRNEVRMAREIP